MNANFYDRALTRIKYLALLVGLVGTAAMFFARGRGAAAGFLAGAGLSYVNFELLSAFAHGMVSMRNASASKARGWGVLIALRYAIVGVAVYVIVRILGITPVAVLAGLLAVFAAVILEILYELILHART
jgi:ATP synthase I chain